MLIIENMRDQKLIKILYKTNVDRNCERGRSAADFSARWGHKDMQCDVKVSRSCKTSMSGVQAIEENCKPSKCWCECISYDRTCRSVWRRDRGLGEGRWLVTVGRSINRAEVICSDLKTFDSYVDARASTVVFTSVFLTCSENRAACHCST